LGESIKKEVTLMKMIKHKNVVRLIEVLASNSKIYIVLELIRGGDLFDAIKCKFSLL
jgi:5'-AMP-activated protein kinase catalytic alpha subunit